MTGTLHMSVFLPLTGTLHMSVFLQLEFFYFQGKNITKVTQCDAQTLLTEEGACACVEAL